MRDPVNAYKGALSLQWSGYHAFARFGLLLLALALPGALLFSRWMTALMLGVLLLPAIYVVARQHERLPAVLQALFVIAMLFNATGYLFNWFTDWTPFDKIAHFYSGFAVTIVFAFIVYSPVLPGLRPHPLLLSLVVTTLGITIAALWEIAEWSAEFATGERIMRSIDDTIVDILMGAAGASLAACLATLIVTRRSRGVDKQPTAESMKR